MPGYISEYSYYGYANTEFVELAIPQGTDTSGYSVILYQGNGTIVESWGLGSVQSTTDGHDVYVIDNNTPDFSSMNGSGEIWADDAIALVDGNGNVVQFLSHEGNTVTATEGPANGMTSTNVGSVNRMGDSMETSDRGASYQPQSNTNKGTIACFAPGVMIDTPHGPRAVETLAAGDAVITLAGPRRILWAWSGDQPLDGARTDQKPVQIKAGALGAATPTHDLVVSCQHRMLLGGRGAFATGFEDEALVPAKALTMLTGIRSLQGKRHIRWHHFALAQHGIIRANGAWSESLLLAPQVLANLPARDRTALFHRLRPPRGLRIWNGPPARPCLSVSDTRKRLSAALQPG